MNYFEAEDSWKSNDEWRLADKEAAWKFFFAAGKDAPQKVISAQCVKMNQYENIIFEIRDQLAAAQEENGRLENQVLARDAELWGRTQEILGLKDQLAKAEQRVAEWQPIETAPKDGTDMLCCGWRYNQPKNDWFHTVCWWNGHGFVDDSGDVDFVIHWMPLPKAPASGASS